MDSNIAESSGIAEQVNDTTQDNAVEQVNAAEQDGLTEQNGDAEQGDAESATLSAKSKETKLAAQKPAKEKNVKLDTLDNYKNHLFPLYSGERLNGLAESIASGGVYNPIIVRPISGTDRYEILSGHNRANAARLLGRKSIRASVREGLSDSEAEQIVVDSNMNQQSFHDWNYSERIKALYADNKLKEGRSRQGERNDLREAIQQGSYEQKSGKKTPRETTRDRQSKELGISHATLQRYKSIAGLEESAVNAICELLDKKQVSFLTAYHFSQIRENERNIALEIVGGNNGNKIAVERTRALYEKSKGSEIELTEEEIKKELLTKETVKEATVGNAAIEVNGEEVSTNNAEVETDGAEASVDNDEIEDGEKQEGSKNAEK